MDRPVADDDEVGFEFLPVFLDKGGHLRAPDLFFSLEQEFDIAGQAAAARQQGLDGQELRKVLALVVAHTSGVKSSVAHSRLEGRSNPFFQWLWRVHIIVTIQEDSGRTRLPGILPEYHRPARRRDNLCLQLHAPHNGRYVLGDIRDANTVSADARTPQVIDQPAKKFLPQAVNIAKDIRQVKAKF